LFVCRKTITIEIIDRDQYQRNETFIARLGEPSLVTDDDEVENSVCDKEYEIFVLIHVFLQI
jgi:hypothetical protein